MLRHGNIVLGYAGMANPVLLEKIMPGTGFVFELNGDILFTAKNKEMHFTPLPKFQDAWRDISMLLPLSYTVQEITAIIRHVSPAIVAVELVDFFQKEEWHDVRSITMRFFIRNEERTLVTEEIDALYNTVVTQLKMKGATIR